MRGDFFFIINHHVELDISGRLDGWASSTERRRRVHVFWNLTAECSGLSISSIWILYDTDQQKTSDRLTEKVRECLLTTEGVMLDSITGNLYYLLMLQAHHMQHQGLQHGCCQATNTKLLCIRDDVFEFQPHQQNIWKGPDQLWRISSQYLKRHKFHVHAAPFILKTLQQLKRWYCYTGHC